MPVSLYVSLPEQPSNRYVGMPVQWLADMPADRLIGWSAFR